MALVPPPTPDYATAFAVFDDACLFNEMKNVSFALKKSANQELRVEALATENFKNLEAVICNYENFQTKYEPDKNC